MPASCRPGDVFKTLKGQLLIQAEAGALFSDTVTYKAFGGQLDGTSELKKGVRGSSRASH